MARNVHSWWRNWLNRSVPALQQRPRLPWRKRLYLEALEERTLLTVNLLGNFTGLNTFSDNGGYEPPDTQGAASPTKVVETVNQAIAIYTPSGGGVADDSLAHFFGTVGGLAPADSGSFYSDPVVTYDPLVQRFIVGDQNVDFSSTPAGVFDIAVSKSSDPATLTTADWNFFQVNTQEGTADSDYPGNLGYNADALVFTVNEFGSDVHSQVNSISMSALVNGTPLVKGTNSFQTDLSGIASARPTAMQDSKTGDPMWLVAESNGSTQINVIKMTNVLSNSPTYTNNLLTVNTYSPAVAPRQPGGGVITTRIDSRIMNSMEMNNTLVTDHTVSNGSGNLDQAQWYEIDVSSGTPTLLQQGDVSGGAGTYFAYPSIAINSQGTIGMDYLSSGTAAGQYMSMYVTGRTPSDSSGTMETPVLVEAGNTVYGGGREGDLSGINVASDGSFWSVSEFADSNIFGYWNTEIGHFSVGSGTAAATVTNTNDSGTGSLRAAIAAVNAGTDSSIVFSISGSGLQTIKLSSALPAITANGVYINGLSQGGSGNTVPLIEIDGTSAGSGSDGLLINGSNNTVSGLIIENFNGNGIEVTGNSNSIGVIGAGAGNTVSGNAGDGILLDSSATGNQVLSNFVGTNVGGTAALGNGTGIVVLGSSNSIGSTVAAGHNLISGNTGDGLKIGGTASNVLVASNYIGTNYSGVSAVGNGTNGVEIASSNNTLGGSTSALHNIISGNTGDGVLIDGGASGVAVQNEFIGTNVQGTAAMANGVGIEVASSGNTIGGTVSGARNLISGNKTDGVLIDSGVTGVQVQGNYVGTDHTGTLAVGNSIGISDAGNNNTIGGSVTGVRNVISGNTADGVQINLATGVAVQGNFIGVNVGSSAALANGTNGVEVNGNGNTIGGTASAARNVLSGNTNDGVLLDSGVSGNVVLGDFIGVGSNGKTKLGNSNNGVEDDGTSNTIGGTASGARNVISGNTKDGVLYGSTANKGVMQDNYVGIDVGSSVAVGNSSGVEILGTNNTIGGTSGAARNLISGNVSDGIVIDGSASGNQVQGNYVGTNNAASAAFANGYGIVVSASNNTIGGTANGARNVISGNTNDGIFVSASSISVQGNYVGTNASGTSKLGNGTNGVEVNVGSNTIGGTSVAARNVISGNGGDGVLIEGSLSTGVVVQGNLIGTNVSGSGALANSIGVAITGGQVNTIGGTASGARNVISGNTNDGVYLGSGASGESVLGNFIGINLASSAALANGTNGVEIAGANNTIGGSVAGVRNVISGNTNDGVLMDNGSLTNVVQGNFIGTDSSGTKVLGNKGNGVEDDGTNTIGGTVAAAHNIISANTKDGILYGSTASGGLAQGNFVGLDTTGSKALANGTGVEIAGNNVTLGGTTLAARNIVSGNTGSGVSIDSSATGNQVQGNFIGTDHTGAAALANGAYGVTIAGSNNSVGSSVGAASNTIAFNSTGGVDVSAGNDNTIRWNSIFSNGASKTGPGIVEAAGANNNIVAPTITSATYVGTTLTVKGTFTATANVTYVLEFFANPTGDAEGKVFLGRLTIKPTSTGTASFTYTTTTSIIGSDPVVTSTLTDGTGDTSAFSAGVTA